MSALTVVIPAHDEEALIADAVRAVAAASAIDVIVVANGCTDRTVENARAASESVRVIDVTVASKIHALNAGIAAVEVFPVAFVDADVTVNGDDLLELAERLAAHPKAEVASPKMRVLPSRSWWVRQYYRAWALTDYRSEGHIGSGIYMLSANGRSRFADFPEVIADDLYVQRLFAVDERLTPDDLFFSVGAPATIRSLIKRNTRIAAGNHQIAELYPELAAPSGRTGARSLVSRVWRQPGLWLGFGVYTLVYFTSHRRARGLRKRQQRVEWSRDESTRSTA